MVMYQRILVAMDGSPTGELGLKEAIQLALPTKATLVLLHVLDDFSAMLALSTNWNVDNERRAMRREGERMLEKAQRQVTDAGLPCEHVLREVKGEPTADVIVAYAQQAHCDLIVMGTHGRRGLSRLTMGSDAELVLRQAPVPVLLARLPEMA
jgi:nucleotide-binding universal stress UspA family protein